MMSTGYVSYNYRVCLLLSGMFLDTNLYIDAVLTNKGALT